MSAVPVGASPVGAMMAAVGAAAPREASTELRFAQMNAWNLFDVHDDAITADTVLTAEQYSTRLSKLAIAIRDGLAGPDIIGFQEIENDQVLRDLAARPELHALGYRVAAAPLNDDRGIRAGMLYRGDVLEVTRASSPNPVPREPLADGSPGQLNHALLYSRSPLLVDFRVRGAAQAIEGQQLTVGVAHFKSKIGGDRYEPRRELQGAYLGGIVERSRERPNTPMVVLGDLNASPQDGAYKRLVFRADGTRRLHDASDLLPEAERYSYVYRGKRELLDHILVTPDLQGAMVQTQVTRFNTGPGDGKQQWVPGTATGSSDHDFLVTRIDLAKIARPPASPASAAPATPAPAPPPAATTTAGSPTAS
jgi:predicted extracellular nuclease